MAPLVVLTCLMLGVFNILARPSDRLLSVMVFGVAMLCAWGHEHAARSSLREACLIGWFASFVCLLGAIAWLGVAISRDGTRLPRARAQNPMTKELRAP